MNISEFYAHEDWVEILRIKGMYMLNNYLIVNMTVMKDYINYNLP